MPTLREAAQQALEALKSCSAVPHWPALQPTIDALRAALAQEQAEPVAKVELMTTGGNAGLATRIVEIDNHLRERLRPGQLLYTAPPRRTMVPLTDEEIVALVRPIVMADMPDEMTDYEIARAVEKASWEKNNG